MIHIIFKEYGVLHLTNGDEFLYNQIPYSQEEFDKLTEKQKIYAYVSDIQIKPEELPRVLKQVQSCHDNLMDYLLLNWRNSQKALQIKNEQEAEKEA